MRKTKIICTLGPASSSPEVIRELLRKGMNAARLNFSHGTREEHIQTIHRLRSIAKELDLPLSILQDLQGPKMRIGGLEGGQRVVLKPRAKITLTTRNILGDENLLSTTYQKLPQDVTPGDTILLADGIIELEVLSVDGTDVHCKVVHGGILAEHQGLNVPRVSVSAPALTERDKEDLQIGLEQKVDYIALSFVRNAKDIKQIKELIAQKGHSVPVIAKLETRESLENIQEILSAADGVMIARGDLGVELSIEKVPLWQKRIIEMANRARVLVITATQMMESMIVSPYPTRAEASDVANAVLDGTDALMLSGETAVGAFPVEAVQIMDRIVRESETAFHRARLPSQITTSEPFSHSLSYAAQQIVELNPSVSNVAVFTQSGYSARMASKDRPNVPIIAFTPDADVYNRLALLWGVVPYMCGYIEDLEMMVAEVDRVLQEKGYAKQGQLVVIMGGLPLNVRGTTNFIRIHRIGAPAIT